MLGISRKTLWEKMNAYGPCAIACKTENNSQDRAKGQAFNWADFIFTTEGRFPNVEFTARPVLCNHCTDAPCVEACPVTPKAMHKHKNGMTIHNQERCIGCRFCQQNCPYSSEDLDQSKAAYSVISFNDFTDEVHPFYRDKKELIPGCTASGHRGCREGWSHAPAQAETCTECGGTELSGALLRPAGILQCP